MLRLVCPYSPARVWCAQPARRCISPPSTATWTCNSVCLVGVPAQKKTVECCVMIQNFHFFTGIDRYILLQKFFFNDNHSAGTFVHFQFNISFMLTRQISTFKRAFLYSNLSCLVGLLALDLLPCAIGLRWKYDGDKTFMTRSWSHFTGHQSLGLFNFYKLILSLSPY